MIQIQNDRIRNGIHAQKIGGRAVYDYVSEPFTLEANGEYRSEIVPVTRSPETRGDLYCPDALRGGIFIRIPLREEKGYASVRIVNTA